jgi:small subunit ribosomal protein S2
LARRASDNYQTVQKSIQKLKDIETMREDGRFDMLTKKERLKLDREHEGLMKNLAGIKDMGGPPDMMFIIDVRKEDIAVKEANRLDIPIVAVVDTNCSPEGIDLVIPGNDDALRAIRLFASRIADAILEGRQVATEGSIALAESEEEESSEAPVAEIGSLIAIPKEFRSEDDDDDTEIEEEAEDDDDVVAAEAEEIAEDVVPSASEAEVADVPSGEPAAGETAEEKTEESNEAAAS